MTIVVRGVPEAQAALRSIAGELSTLETADARAADIIVTAARPPVRSGRLKRSVRRFEGPGLVVGSDLPYARKIEARTHFLERAFDGTAVAWLEAYELEVAAICDRGGGI